MLACAAGTMRLVSAAAALALLVAVTASNVSGQPHARMHRRRVSFSRHDALHPVQGEVANVSHICSQSNYTKGTLLYDGCSLSAECCSYYWCQRCYLTLPEKWSRECCAARFLQYDAIYYLLIIQTSNQTTCLTE